MMEYKLMTGSNHVHTVTLFYLTWILKMKYYIKLVVNILAAVIMFLPDIKVNKIILKNVIMVNSNI